MIILVIYRCQAPRSYEAESIKTETWSRSPQEVLSLIPSEGDTLALQSDYPEEYGEELKEYKVLECHYGSTQWGTICGALRTSWSSSSPTSTATRTLLSTVSLP